MGSRVIQLSRPEGGEEHGVSFLRHHNCKNAKTFRAALEDPDVDLLLWPVGVVGYEMPLNTPFAVQTSNECGVCGAILAAWFEWVGPKLILPS